MEETASAKPSWFSAYKRKVLQPRTLGLAALALALGAAASGIGWHIWLKPMRAAAERRYQTYRALMRLYALQTSYRAGHEAYADDLESLLASAPDGAQIRESLRANTDLGTLTVVGDARRFKLEANVLDPERTSIKIRGPIPKRVRARPRSAAP